MEETYDELEAELTQRIAGIQHQIEFASDKRNTIIRINRVAKTAMDVFHDILEKPTLDRNDLNLMIEKIRVYEDHIEVQLKADIDSLLKTGTLPEDAVNFKQGTENIENTLIQSSKNHEDKVFRVSVISSGDPLEIYTEKDGEVIFKKYSPMGDLTDSAAQICESIGKNTGHIAVVCDRDSIIAVAGAPRRELADKRISQELIQLMEARKVYRAPGGAAPLPILDGFDRYRVAVAAPVLSEGDLMGCVALLLEGGDAELGEAEQKLVQTVAGFLGKQMEN